LLASVLIAKGDRAGALQHFRKYLEIVPKAPDADQVKRAIAQLEAPVEFNHAVRIDEVEIRYRALQRDLRRGVEGRVSVGAQPAALPGSRRYRETGSTKYSSLCGSVVDPSIEIPHIPAAIQGVHRNGHHHVGLAHQRFAVLVLFAVGGGDHPDIEVRAGVGGAGRKETRGTDLAHQIRAAAGAE
jgi:hypothetical protein